jgi:hypothetical protein
VNFCENPDLLIDFKILRKKIGQPKKEQIFGKSISYTMDFASL